MSRRRSTPGSAPEMAATRLQHELLGGPNVESAMFTRGRSESLQAIDVLHELFLRQRHPNTHAANSEARLQSGVTRAETLTNAFEMCSSHSEGGPDANATHTLEN